MSIPDLSPFEQVKVLENFVKSVEKKRADFAHRIEIMKFSREGRTPTQEFVMQFQSLIEDELRLVEADELVIQNRKKTGMNTDEILVNAVNTQGPKVKEEFNNNFKSTGEHDKPPISLRKIAQAIPTPRRDSVGSSRKWILLVW